MSDYRQTLAELLSAPRDGLHGFLGGLLGPILALAGAVGLLYVLTRRLPAIKEVTRATGERDKALFLAPQAEARASWARFGGDLRGAILEVKGRGRRA